MKKGVIKAFREYLNEYYRNSPKWKNYKYQQRVRGYGDYLYCQDRDMFKAVLEPVLRGEENQYQDFIYYGAYKEVTK